MKLSKIILPAITGTSAMTLFSYLMSDAEKHNYREPDVLKQLIRRLTNGVVQDKAQLAGWLAHYGAGVLFEIVLAEAWKRKYVKPSVASGALLGAVSGLAGVLVWKTVFKAHPNPPAKNLRKFFGHLILAHIVFGVFSALTYKVVDTTTDENKPL
jgi:Na+/proline symporter